MKIAVMSDIHDNVWKLEAALTKLRELQPDALICCGDLCSPFIVGLMTRALHDEQAGLVVPIHVVFGNNDADLYRITAQAKPDRLIFYGELAEFVVQDERLRPRHEFVEQGTNRDTFFDPAVQGKRIAVNHFNYLARPLAASGKYDAVFYGHNHKRRHERLGQCDIINPGALMGYDPTASSPAERYIDATFVVYDTADGSAPQWYTVVAEVEGGAVRQVVREYNHVPVETFSLS